MGGYSQKMIKQKKNLFIAIGLTVIITLAFAGVVAKMLIENGKCVDDPFGYSAQRLEESGGMYMCGCSSLDPELLDFSFDSDGITIEETAKDFKIDFDNIIIK